VLTPKKKVSFQSQLKSLTFKSIACCWYAVGMMLLFVEAQRLKIVNELVIKSDKL